jgi:hypothetical protein
MGQESDLWEWWRNERPLLRDEIEPDQIDQVEIRESIRSMRERLLGSPFVRAKLALGNGPVQAVDTAIGEQFMWVAIALTNVLQDRPEDAMLRRADNTFGLHEVYDPRRAQYVAGMLLTAPIYIWRTRLLREIPQIPVNDLSEITPHMMDSPVMLFNWETGLEPRVGDAPQMSVTTDVTLFVAEPEAMLRIDLGSIDGQPYVQAGSVPWGKVNDPIPVDSESEGIDPDVYTAAREHVWRLFAFMRGKLHMQPLRLSRQVRRRLGDEWQPRTDVSMVTLRRLEQEGNGSHKSDGNIDWQWRWWNSSHIRNQWYPSLQAHLPIVIDAFLKGPPDKPIKPRVFDVRR